jgi:hypothetical protein
MKLVELLNGANTAYPDGELAEYYDELTGQFDYEASGDTLAEFIVSELTASYDEAASDERQLAEAIRTMETARHDLDGVVGALRVMAENVPKKEAT